MTIATETSRSYCVWICSILLCGACLSAQDTSKAAQDRTERVWSSERLQLAVQQRVNAIEAIDITLLMESRSDKSYWDYLAAKKASKSAFFKFWGHKEAKSEDSLVEPQADLVGQRVNRWQFNSSADERYEFCEALEDLTSRATVVCNNGGHWQTVYSTVRTNRPKVVLTAEPPILDPIGRWIGIRGPLWSLIDTYRFLHRLDMPLADSLKDLSVGNLPQGEVEELGDTPETAVVRLSYYPVETAIRSAPVPVPLFVMIDFSIAYGMAPVRMTTTEKVLRDGSYQEIKTPKISEVAWSRYSEVSNGVWLPGLIEISQFETVVLPDEKTGIRPSTSDSDVALTSSSQTKAFDPSSVTQQRFLIKKTTITPSEGYRLNGDAAEVACENQFEPGTLIYDRTIGEVFQLTGISPAVGATLKKVIERTKRDGGTPITLSDPTSLSWLWIVNGGMLVIFVVVAVLSRRSKHGAAKSKT